MHLHSELSQSSEITQKSELNWRKLHHAHNTHKAPTIKKNTRDVRFTNPSIHISIWSQAIAKKKMCNIKQCRRKEQNCDVLMHRKKKTEIQTIYGNDVNWCTFMLQEKTITIKSVPSEQTGITMECRKINYYAGWNIQYQSNGFQIVCDLWQMPWMHQFNYEYAVFRCPLSIAHTVFGLWSVLIWNKWKILWSIYSKSFRWSSIFDNTAYTECNVVCSFGIWWERHRSLMFYMIRMRRDEEKNDVCIKSAKVTDLWLRRQSRTQQEQPNCHRKCDFEGFDG